MSEKQNNVRTRQGQARKDPLGNSRTQKSKRTGKLPADLKRGVLSEDAVYDLMTEHRELLVRMLRLVTDALESDGVS